MRDSWDVYAKSGVVCMGVCLANLELELRLTPFIPDRALRWTTAFAVIQGIAIISLVFYLLGRRTIASLKRAFTSSFGRPFRSVFQRSR